MKNIFPQEIYVAFTLLSSIGVFAYFKYVKNEIIDYKVSLVIGVIFMAAGWLSIVIFYPSAEALDFLLFKERASFVIKKLLLVGYIFFLLSGMTLLSNFIAGSKEET